MSTRNALTNIQSNTQYPLRQTLRETLDHSVLMFALIALIIAVSACGGKDGNGRKTFVDTGTQQKKLDNSTDKEPQDKAQSQWITNQHVDLYDVDVAITLPNKDRQLVRFAFSTQLPMDANDITSTEPNYVSQEREDGSFYQAWMQCVEMCSKLVVAVYDMNDSDESQIPQFFFFETEDTGAKKEYQLKYRMNAQGGDNLKKAVDVHLTQLKELGILK